MARKKVIVIGAGFAGLSAASGLAQAGYEVLVVEKNGTPGGRARSFQAEGFTFDMGPSWYWMPDVFESFFGRFGKSPSDYYDLVRLDPSYQVVFDEDNRWDIPASMPELEALFESVEPGSGPKLRAFLDEARYKYEVGIGKLVYKPGQSLMEWADWEFLKGVGKLDVFKSITSHVKHFFKHPDLIRLLEFPVLFLGAMPSKTPALYSLMNYADMSLGTWYPQGGMHQIVRGMESLASELGVQFRYHAAVDRIEVENGRTKGVVINGELIEADAIVGGADYHHVEQHLLPAEYRTYTENYWDKRTMAPSSLIYYLGVNKHIPGLDHHNLFFDRPFDVHAKEIYENPTWPSDPLFYACCPSKTDSSVAPEGCENLFVLIPVAPGLEDTPGVRQHYFDRIMDRLEKMTGTSIRDSLVYKRSYAHKDFEMDYHAYKGNAYGLANTWKQTAFLKPAIKSKKLENLFYTGQLTLPGPGVPPALISGLVVTDQVAKHIN